MEIGVKTVLFPLNPKIIIGNQRVEGCVRNLSWRGTCPSFQNRHFAPQLSTRRSFQILPATFAVLSGAKDAVEISPSEFENFSVTAESTNESGELKLSIEVSGTTTQTIFDEVFDKMVEEAQPIPGFRRVKGGKTPNIPKNILLEVLGPSNVFKQVIERVINSTIAEYVEKGDLKVSKDLRVEQSFEDLEAMFEAGEEFSFSAVLRLQEMN
ncbi:uncharacterized protein LOC107406063 [Ziziphus jujuba]|uniref:peptidylprolyl isomerase n=3 Tax=Ziziphus jujuba TaxID=326968 RepID=A0A6P3Z3J1_ZIZJJ|nr:uncharacterized protein LOC107406063 [Ziziphus jujuba]XP_015868658.3 uncharacterized protein LOC107406063 [Ziziphus jujuba]